MTLQQLRSTDGTGTLTYLLIDEHAKIAAVIDPNISDVDRIAAELTQRGVNLETIIDTHTHVDHVSGAAALREKFGAQVVMHENTKDKWKIVEQGDTFGIGDTLRANAAVPIDRYVNDGDTIAIGENILNVMHTPGHTDNSITLQIGGAIFPGDLLLVGQAGRSDLPGGSASDQYDSIFKKILILPDVTKIFPGHDYNDNTFVLLGDEKRTNPFLQSRSREEYIEFVKDFFPPIHEAGPGGHVTLQCGATRVMSDHEPFKNMAVPALASMLRNHLPMVLIDVREPFELVQLGAIHGVQNIPTGELESRAAELPADKNAPIVVVCRSGMRSQEAAHFLATNLGYTNVASLEGGTLAWIREGNEVERE